MFFFSLALVASKKSKKKKHLADERVSESDPKKVKQLAVEEEVKLAGKRTKKWKEKKKSSKELDVVQPALKSISKNHSNSSSDNDMEVEVCRPKTKAGSEMVGPISLSPPAVKAGKKRSSTTTSAKLSSATKDSDAVPEPKKRRLLAKTSECKDETGQRVDSRSELPKKKQDKETRVSKASVIARKTSGAATAKSVTASKVCASQKAAATSTVAVGDSSSDTESSDSDSLRTPKPTTAPSLSSKNVSKTPPVEKSQTLVVAKTPSTDSSSEEASGGSSDHSVDGNPRSENEKLKNEIFLICACMCVLITDSFIKSKVYEL